MHTRKVKSHVRMMKVVRDYESSSSIEYPLIPQTVLLGHPIDNFSSSLFTWYFRIHQQVPLYYVHSKTKDDVSTAEVESYGLELQDTPGRVVISQTDRQTDRQAD